MLGNRLLTSYHTQFFVISLAWMLGFLYSMEFVLSLSMGLFVLSSIFQWNSGKLHIRTTFLENLKRLSKVSAWWWTMIPFVLIVLTAAYSTEDTTYLLARLRIKVPYLILPFAFLSMPALSRKLYYQILYVFVILVSLTSLGTLLNYLYDYERINTIISQGQPMPTPTNHIRFSLMIVLAIFQAMVLCKESFVMRYQWEKWLLVGVGMFLLVFLHILSVRSGIAIFYLSALVLLLRYVLVSQKYVWGLLAIVGLSLLPVGAYHSFPSLQNKVNYMIWDLKMYAKGEGASNSDSDRITSLLTAASIIKKHPILGVGAGDVKQQMLKEYDTRYPNLPEYAKKMPHNQFVSVTVGAGVIGLILFLLGGVIPLWNHKRYQDITFLALNCVIFFSFLVENTIENAVGVAFHTLFLFMGMNVLQIRKP